MFKVLKLINKGAPLLIRNPTKRVINRTFLTQNYYCNEIWEHRMNDPILQKVNLDELYQNLEQRFNRHGTISAIDVDIFANAVNHEMYIDELLDLVHKLRLSADTSNTLESTTHAVVRCLLQNNRRDELLSTIDDRLNYGIFLDYYTANLLMDHFYKANDFAAGVLIGSQLMLQEDMNHAISKNLTLLHCINYLLNPTGWLEKPKIEEPEDEVKVRVKYLRNPYFDDHFDLENPIQIVGKTLITATKGSSELLDTSLHILGLALFEKHEKATEFIKMQTKILTEVLNLFPAESPVRDQVEKLQQEPGELKTLLSTRVKEATDKMSEKDLENQCKIYNDWQEIRKDALQKQMDRLSIEKRIANIETTQQSLKIREEKLWFFENEEQIELAIEAKFGDQSKPVETKSNDEKDKKPTKQNKKKIDEDYIPPEV